MKARATTIRLLTPRLVVAFVVALMILAAGCRETGSSASNAKESASTRTEGDITIHTRLNPNTLTVAQSAELTITLETSTPVEIEWPDVAAVVEPNFEVTRAQTVERETMPGGVIRHSRRFELQPLLPGEYELPRLPVLLDHDTLIETDPVKLVVASVFESAEEGALAPRKGVADPPVDYGFWALLTGGVATGLLLVGAITYLLVRQARLREDAMPLRPAHEIAIERLEELLRSDLLERGRFEIFLSELSAILRHYIEDRFALHAPQQTTEEFLHVARASDALDAARTGELAHFLSRCDLVKFARAGAARHEIDSAVDMVRTFIENSRESDASHAKEAA